MDGRRGRVSSPLRVGPCSRPLLEPPFNAEPPGLGPCAGHSEKFNTKTVERSAHPAPSQTRRTTTLPVSYTLPHVAGRAQTSILENAFQERWQAPQNMANWGVSESGAGAWVRAGGQGRRAGRARPEGRRLEKERWSGCGSSTSLPEMVHCRHSPSLSSTQLVPLMAMYAARPAMMPAQRHPPLSQVHCACALLDPP